MLSQLDLELKTNNLTLRPLRIGDEELLWPHVTNEAITRYMAWQPHSKLSQTREFVEAEVIRVQQHRGATWSIFQSGDFCGIISLIGLLRTHRSLTYDKAELAYWLVPSRQGQGIMSEAGWRILDFAFNDMNLHKISVGHFGPNDSSRKLIERLGFSLVGRQVEEFRKNGVWYDHILYELLRRDFQVGKD